MRWNHWTHACRETWIKVLLLIYSDTDERTVDLGNPQLSMHSCRETGGSKDVESAVKLFKTFFEEFGSVEPYVYGGELKL